MDYIRYLFISAFILGIHTCLTEGEFTCFRKYRKKRDNCGGIVRRKKFNTPEKCCDKKGQGFTEEPLEKIKKNKYVCTSCKEWEQSQLSSTTATLTTTVTVATTTADPRSAEWGVWGHCSTSCGAGWRSRYKQCPTCDPTNYRNVQSEPCILNYYCPVDGSWGPWHSWHDCSTTCGGGTRTRDRRCNYPPPTHGGLNCEGPAEETEPCNELPCPVDGSWSQWSRFSDCSASCGQGSMSRTRNCDSPRPVSGGSPCRGSRVQHKRCEKRRCPIHGGWSTWEAWSVCPGVCGSGARTRSRECERPYPLFGGRSCDGEGTETEECRHEEECPVHGGWSDWSTYGRCRGAPCGRGFMLRSRVCNNPRPRHKGRLCVGRAVIRMPCESTEGCAVNGGWCPFEDWSPCSATCASLSSIQTRRRTCTCPHPNNGGNICDGSDVQLQTCTGVSPCGFSDITVEKSPTFVDHSDVRRAEPGDELIEQAVIEE